MQINGKDRDNSINGAGERAYQSGEKMKLDNNISSWTNNSRWIKYTSYQRQNFNTLLIENIKEINISNNIIVM